MLRKGFTLIELLIVITIIAILAGAAIPFVQDYVEDARISKAKADLDEIKNALIRYELDSGKLWTDVTITNLVGAYLAKALIDPWGSAYVINPASSLVYSVGPDRTDGSADDILQDFRAPLALSKAYWVDADKDGTVNPNDQIKLRFTREADPATLAAADFELSINGAAWAAFSLGTVVTSVDDRDFVLSINASTFVPGRDEMRVVANAVDDKATIPTSSAPNPSKSNAVVIKGL
ncbi:MAG: prepilin-type N-terminal cleavage/methylation domain-containing protein [Candidatus Riflebacteria bacterium]